MRSRETHARTGLDRAVETQGLIHGEERPEVGDQDGAVRQQSDAPHVVGGRYPIDPYHLLVGDTLQTIDGVDPDKLDAVLLTFDPGRAAQKAKYGGELFPASFAANSAGDTFLDFFQKDKSTGQPKGIVAIDLVTINL